MREQFIAPNFLASNAVFHSYFIIVMKNILFTLIIASSVALSACETQKTTTTTGAASLSGNGPVRIINGKRYVWVAPELGSHLPGRWVPEDSMAAQGNSSVETGNADAVRRFQDHAGEGAPPGSH